MAASGARLSSQGEREPEVRAMFTSYMSSPGSKLELRARNQEPSVKAMVRI